jgi:hypothetical protein
MNGANPLPQTDIFAAVAFTVAFASYRLSRTAPFSMITLTPSETGNISWRNPSVRSAGKGKY